MRRAYDIAQLILVICIGMLALGVGGANLIFGITPHIVLSGSMEPTIPTGSLCFINERLKTPQKGDIIAFYKGEMSITHRVVDIKEAFYTTKGDHNAVPDPAPVHRKELMGTTIFWIPGMGYAAAFLQSRRGIIFTITALTVFILMGYMLPEKRRRIFGDKK